jgi:hypothetical protein
LLPQQPGDPVRDIAGVHGVQPEAGGLGQAPGGVGPQRLQQLEPTRDRLRQRLLDEPGERRDDHGGGQGVVRARHACLCQAERAPGGR